MISGLNASGITTAIRTAGQARATMDTMTRQIATGQRVSSVSDDGAAWTRAQGIRSDAATWDWRAGEARRFQPVADISATHIEEGLRLQRDVLLLLQQAQNSAAGGDERRRFFNDWQDMQGRWSALKTVYDQLTVDYGAMRSQGVPLAEWAIRPWENSEAFLQNLTIPDAWWLSSAGSTGFGITLSGYSPNLAVIDVNFMTANGAHFSGAIAELQTSLVSIARTELQAARLSSAASGLARAEDTANAMRDRLMAGAASLTDADLGRVSASRAQAETRQQLALATIQQAISTYGNFAGGLLGNVQRTQRGVLA